MTKATVPLDYEAVKTTIADQYGKPGDQLPTDTKHAVAHLLYVWGFDYGQIAQLLGYHDRSGARKAVISGQRAGAISHTVDELEKQLTALHTETR